MTSPLPAPVAIELRRAVVSVGATTCLGLSTCFEAQTGVAVEAPVPIGRGRVFHQYLAPEQLPPVQLRASQRPRARRSPNTGARDVDRLFSCQDEPTDRSWADLPPLAGFQVPEPFGAAGWYPDHLSWPSSLHRCALAIFDEARHHCRSGGTDTS